MQFDNMTGEFTMGLYVIPGGVFGFVPILVAAGVTDHPDPHTHIILSNPISAPQLFVETARTSSVTRPEAYHPFVDSLDQGRGYRQLPFDVRAIATGTDGGYRSRKRW